MWKFFRAAAVAAALAVGILGIASAVQASPAAKDLTPWPACVVAVVTLQDGSEAAVPGGWHFVPTAYVFTADGRAYATAGYWLCEVDRLTTPQALLAAMGR
ncbi:MAG: hypothetical protein QJR08_00495 [Bacillota bacterium]|nr:hypothetical protein [Bacillota bacterium]